jgi:hypothetical protein
LDPSPKGSSSARSCPRPGWELNVGDITQTDANIHAGVKYMRFMMDQYCKDDPMGSVEHCRSTTSFCAIESGVLLLVEM